MGGTFPRAYIVIAVQNIVFHAFCIPSMNTFGNIITNEQHDLFCCPHSNNMLLFKNGMDNPGYVYTQQSNLKTGREIPPHPSPTQLPTPASQKSS